jgi:hypothetical protein
VLLDEAFAGADDDARAKCLGLLATFGLAGGESEPLKGPPAESPWDPRLAAEMRASGRAVMEERLIPLLLADLEAG